MDGTYTLIAAVYLASAKENPRKKKYCSIVNYGRIFARGWINRQKSVIYYFGRNGGIYT